MQQESGRRTNKERTQATRAALLVLLDPSGTVPNLVKFLADNGAGPRNDRVLYAESTPAGPKKQFSVQTLFLPDSPISQPFTEVASTLSGQTQSLALKLDSADLRAQHIEVKPLMQATEKYWGELFYTEALPVASDGDTQPPVYVAASIERGAVSDERLRVDSSRMVVVGNSSMLDPLTRLGVHQDFIAASLNWMMNREKRAEAIRADVAGNDQDVALGNPGEVAVLITQGDDSHVYLRQRKARKRLGSRALAVHFRVRSFNGLEGKPAVCSQVKQLTSDDIALALAAPSHNQRIHDKQPTRSAYRTVGVVHSMLHGLAPTRLRASSQPPHNSALRFATATRPVPHRPGRSHRRWSWRWWPSSPAREAESRVQRA